MRHRSCSRHYAATRKIRVRFLVKSLDFPKGLIVPPVLGPGVYSAPNRNEYQKQRNNVSGEWRAAGA
jgi:hypothetical protein